MGRKIEVVTLLQEHFVLAVLAKGFVRQDDAAPYVDLLENGDILG